MSKALVVIKSMGIGDLVILIANIHAISKSINKSVVVLAPKSTHANSILEHDPYVEEVLDLDKNGFFNIIKILRNRNFNQSYIFSDSLRLYLITKFLGISKKFQYPFFSKKGKNFYKTAKKFTETILQTEVNPQPKIFVNIEDINIAKNKFNISNDTNNIICGISASGSTKRWDIKNYIKLFENINAKSSSRFFLAGGSKDQGLIDQVMNSSIGKNCISFSKMSIKETIPIIAACKICISNDTGFAHISSGLGLKCLLLFMDSPPQAYGTYSKNISIIVPQGKTLETCGHNTRGKDQILFDEVLSKALKLLD